VSLTRSPSQPAIPGTTPSSPLGQGDQRQFQRDYGATPEPEPVALYRRLLARPGHGPSTLAPAPPSRPAESAARNGSVGRTAAN
jgi:hypothetical protein